MSLRNTIGSADFEATEFAFPQDAVAGLCADAEYFAHLLNAHYIGIVFQHGDADDIVPLSYSERALEVYPAARLQVLPGAGHGFYGEDAQVAIDAIADYCNALA